MGNRQGGAVRRRRARLSAGEQVPRGSSCGRSCGRFFPIGCSRRQQAGSSPDRSMSRKCSRQERLSSTSSWALGWTRLRGGGLTWWRRRGYLRLTIPRRGPGSESALRRWHSCATIGTCLRRSTWRERERERERRCAGSHAQPVDRRSLCPTVSARSTSTTLDASSFRCCSVWRRNVARADTGALVPDGDRGSPHPRRFLSRRSSRPSCCLSGISLVATTVPRPTPLSA